MNEVKRILIVAHPKRYDKLTASMTLVRVRTNDIICDECGEPIPEGSVAIRSTFKTSLHYFHRDCGQMRLGVRSKVQGFVSKH